MQDDLGSEPIDHPPGPDSPGPTDLGSPRPAPVGDHERTPVDETLSRPATPGHDPNSTYFHPPGPGPAPRPDDPTADDGLGPAPSRRVGQVIAHRFILGSRLGVGGQGEVWRATQTDPIAREVALKLLRPDLEFDPERVERFRLEAERWAKVPGGMGILPIHEFGEDEGRPFITMQLVEGYHLAQVIVQRRRHLASESPVGLHRLATLAEADYLRAIAALLARVARALQVAHDAHIVHRDVKPSNVLLDRDDETGIYLADFGLARNLDDLSLTPRHALVGTLGYIAPERLRGLADIDEARSDVFGLGATLFEAATLERAFDLPKDLVPELRVMYLLGLETPLPRKLRPSIPRDLEAVILKAIDENPSRRYPTAAALADDLVRFAKDEPVEARPPGRARRAARWLRRQPRLLAATILLALVPIGFGSAKLADRERGRAHRGRAEGHLSAGRLPEAASELDRARAFGEGGESGRDLARRLAEAELAEAEDAAFAGNVERFDYWFRQWQAHSGSIDRYRREQTLLIATKVVQIACDAPGALVTMRRLRPDGRPDFRADPAWGPVLADRATTRLIAGPYWLSVGDPSTGAFAERAFDVPWGPPSADQPTLMVQLSPRPTAGPGDPAMARIGAGPVTIGLRGQPSTSTLEIPAFAIDRGEVTQGQFHEFTEATGRGDLAQAIWGDSRRPDPGALDLPVTRVRVAETIEYAAWRGCRLPTEGELARADLEALPASVDRSGPGWLALHPVGSLVADARTTRDGRIVGLASNASELTQFHYRPPRSLGFLSAADPRATGWAGYPVAAGLVRDDGGAGPYLLTPGGRVVQMYETRSPWTGFRCA